MKTDLGAASKPRRGGKNDEAAEAIISKIGDRRASDEGIPGLTVHQAKGREWNHVGFVGPEDQHTALSGGLAIDVDMHRVLYVALTRGRDSIERI